jgi:hypothetical protein
VTESAVGDTDAKEGLPPSGCDIHGATSNVRLTSILLKTPCCDASTGIWGAVTEAKLGLSALCAKIGAGRGMIFATFRRFWAVTGQ